jgi:serine/threonine-protein kinase
MMPPPTPFDVPPASHPNPFPDRRGDRVIHARPEGISASLPTDLVEQVRGRVRLLAGFFIFAFGFDLAIYLVTSLLVGLTGRSMPADAVRTAGFQWANSAAIVASAGLWWAARNRRISADTLHSLGLAYEITICFSISIIAYWSYFRIKGTLPNLTWVPAVVIMFPLIMPGPPRRMLYTAIVAGAMAPLGLLLLELTGRVRVADKGFYFEQSFASLISAAFAWFGARIVYGLGKEVAEARELGSYHLGELLGKGGMGEVYKATHRMLARPSAIKLIRPEMLGGGSAAAAQIAIKRFHREATAAASLRSPHTVELYDFGVTADQTLYFVMELLEGMDLERLVRQKGPLPAARVIHILRQVCESLEEAHSAGLVHRDIKPANIHIGRLGLTWDFVKVLDFGLVKSVEPTTDEHSLATAAGLAPGTPAYMAPEMAMGEAIDGRADLYALGCVAYYLLTGRLVFEAANGMQMIARHMQDAPVSPSERAELPVPAALENLVMTCLAKRPADRPASAAGLSDALAAIPGAVWGQAEAGQWWEANRLS